MYKLTYYMLWLTVFSIPWEEFISIPGVGALSRVFGYITILFAVLAFAQKKRLKNFSAVHYLVMLFLFFNFLSMFWALNIDAAWEKSMRYLRVIGLFWLVFEFVTNDREFSGIIKAFILGSLMSALGILYSYIRNDPSIMMEVDSRYTAFKMNQNDIALVLTIAVGLAFYLASTQRRRWLYWLFMPVAVAALLMTGSRGGLISLALGMLIIVVTQKGISLRGKIALVVSMVVVGYLANLYLPAELVTRYQTTEAELRYGTWTGRTLIWEAGLDALTTSPVVGLGSGCFFVLVGQIFGETVVAHNAYLAVLVETGIIGLVLFTFIFILTLKNVWRLPYLPGIWIAVLLATMAGIFTLSWESRKAVWFLLGLLANLYYLQKNTTRVEKAG